MNGDSTAASAAVTLFESLDEWLKALTSKQPKSASATQNAPAVRCRECRNYITDIEAITPIQGETCHFFTNPRGIGFDLQTYSRAPGCTLGGKPTEFFTWFEGFAWQHCFCNQCQSHLGWYFSCDGTAGFYALITDRLLLNLT